MKLTFLLLLSLLSLSNIAHAKDANGDFFTCYGSVDIYVDHNDNGNCHITVFDNGKLILDDEQATFKASLWSGFKVFSKNFSLDFSEVERPRAILTLSNQKYTGITCHQPGRNN